MKRLLTAAVLVLTMTACGQGVKLFGPDDIEYRVTSTCPTDITVAAPNGGTEQFSNKASGWWYKFQAPADGSTFLYVSAQLNCSGTVNVQILKNGNVFRSNTSSGEYVIATAHN